MLRALLAALVVANLAFFAYSHGWLDGLLGLRPQGDREPERLARQVRPETIRLLPMSPGASSAASGAAACLERSASGANDSAAGRDLSACPRTELTR